MFSIYFLLFSPLHFSLAFLWVTWTYFSIIYWLICSGVFIVFFSVSLCSFHSGCSWPTSNEVWEPHFYWSLNFPTFYNTVLNSKWCDHFSFNRQMWFINSWGKEGSMLCTWLFSNIPSFFLRTQTSLFYNFLTVTRMSLAGLHWHIWI